MYLVCGMAGWPESVTKGGNLMPKSPIWSTLENIDLRHPFGSPLTRTVGHAPNSLRLHGMLTREWTHAGSTQAPRLSSFLRASHAVRAGRGTLLEAECWMNILMLSGSLHLETNQFQTSEP